jgi:TonB family protein
MLKAHLPALLASLAIVLTQTDVVAQRVEPTVIKRVEPVYTDEARAAKIEGTVVLEILIRTDGTVSVLRNIRGLGYGLDESARVAIEQWRFRPRTVNGKAVEATIVIEVNFPTVRPN